MTNPTGAECERLDRLLAFEDADAACDSPALAEHLAACARCARLHFDVGLLLGPARSAARGRRAPPARIERPARAHLLAAAVLLLAAVGLMRAASVEPRRDAGWTARAAVVPCPAALRFERETIAWTRGRPRASGVVSRSLEVRSRGDAR